MNNTIDELMKCPNCESMKNGFEKVKFKNGTDHIQRSCLDCGIKINWASQGKPLDKFVFGKHKGKTFDEVWKEAPDYIRWCLKEFKEGKVKEGLEVWMQQKVVDKDIGDPLS